MCDWREGEAVRQVFLIVFMSSIVSIIPRMLTVAVNCHPDYIILAFVSVII